MSLYKREGSPFWYYEFKIKGRRFRASTETTNKREAERIKKQAKEQAREEVKKKKSDKLTLDQGFGKYWLEHLQHQSASWQRDSKRYIRQILGTIDPDMFIEDITDAEVNDFVQERFNVGGGKYAINRALAVWQGMQKRATKSWKQNCRIIDWTYFKNREEKRERYITLEEAKTLIECCPEYLALAIEWSIYTGCRQFETYGLTWSKIHLDKGFALIKKKGGLDHKVWLEENAIDVLNRSPKVGRYVFSKRNRRKAFEKAALEAGLEDFLWHDLRHTHATWLRQNKIAVEVVQRSLGHADISTTMRYAHVDDYEVREALRKIPSIRTHNTNVVKFNSINSRR